MERTSTLDAEFLYLEDDATMLHIGACAVFEGPAPAFDEFAAMTASKLPRVPRFRQVIRPVPLGLGRPVWLDDPHFLLDYHLRHTAVPAPGGREDLQRLAGRIMDRRLDRARPLWESWMVEGLADDRWAVIMKVHHAMVDGVSGAEMMNVLLDLEPDAPIAEPEPWTPAAWPHDVRLALDAVGGFAGQLRDLAGQLGSVLRHPDRLLENLRQDREGLVAAGQSVSAGPTADLGGSVGPHRRWSWAEADLHDVKKVKDSLGGTVNDVILAAITNGFRSLLDNRQIPVDEHTVRTFVPVSVRGEDEHNELNNKVSGLVANLPVGLTDPAERLARIRAEMDHLKATHGADVAAAVTSLGDLVFPGLLALGSRTAMRALGAFQGSSVGTVTTNVPGPQFPLYALGRELVGYYPYVPIFPGTPVAVAILSYNGRVAFGVTGDYDTAPDVDVVARGIEEGITGLVKAAG